MLSPCCFILAISWPSGWTWVGGEPLAAVRWVWPEVLASAPPAIIVGLTMAANGLSV